MGPPTLRSIFSCWKLRLKAVFWHSLTIARLKNIGSYSLPFLSFFVREDIPFLEKKRSWIEKCRKNTTTNNNLFGENIYKHIHRQKGEKTDNSDTRENIYNGNNTTATATSSFLTYIFPSFSQYIQTYIFSQNMCYSLFPRCEPTGIRTQMLQPAQVCTYIFQQERQQVKRKLYQSKLWGWGN